MTIEIGSGLGIDERSGEMIVLDQARVDEELASSPDPCNRAVAALVGGDLALASDQLDIAAPSLRRDMLHAEVTRAEGHAAEAVALFTALLRTHDPGTGQRAMLLQHLGKAEYAAGQRHAALEHLREALQLRVETEAPADQIASTQLMLHIVGCQDE